MTFDDHFAPEEQAIIEQLRNDPRPRLKPEVANAIQQRILNEMDATFSPSPSTAPGWSLPVPPWLVIAVVVIGVIAFILLARGMSQPVPRQTTTSVPSLIITQTPAASPTGTLTPQPTGTTTASPTDTFTPQPTATATPLPSQPPTVEVTAEATADSGADATILVIEGKVQKITVNAITVLDIDVQVQPGDPILSQLHVGDSVRVEGKAVQQGDTIVIIAVKITIIDSTRVTPPVPGNPGGLPPNCKISKNGKIKCTKEK